MNIKLLREIAKVIIEKPRQFNMNYWHKNEKERVRAMNAGEYKSFGALCDLPQEKQIACDTTHCIAGWAQALSPDRKCKVKADKDAKRLLGLTPTQAKRLFFCSSWPDKFRGKNNDLWNPTRKQAAARIEHFIKTRGAE